MNFGSDNVTGVAPEIMAALVAANQGAAIPYGDDESTHRLQEIFSQLFETEVVIFPVVTGSAANSLALSVITPSFGAIYCHEDAHINQDECGAPEFYTGGAKLVTLKGEAGKISATDLAQRLATAGTGVVHRVQPAAVSITQATEAGTVYSLEEIGAITQVTHSHNLKLHVDGARFANALVTLGCTPAEATWKAGVDVLSFGATKNGAMAAEAVIFFQPELAKTFGYRRKRSGHLLSKMRFLSTQLETYIKEDLWLKNATHANLMANRLATELAAIPGLELRYPVAANEIFIYLPETVISELFAEGFKFYRWEPGGDLSLVRLVTAFDTEPEAIAAFVETVKSCLIVS
ncbi:low specificity L-threonine aldolase [Merismopedia glauca CCAP 1448/3]|uniref:L-threonine aldolase n=2 Tax=Merismopedia TaxID=53402 RepID=A0A2T1C908_9CYAN|nr:low specificity L-threonine aldolase [Merismopedia glauca CCAP 1448/3]